jgi:hypothetical protein
MHNWLENILDFSALLRSYKSGYIEECESLGRFVMRYSLREGWNARTLTQTVRTNGLFFIIIY